MVKRKVRKRTKKTRIIAVLLVVLGLLWAMPLWAGGRQEKRAEPAAGKTEAAGKLEGAEEDSGSSGTSSDESEKDAGQETKTTKKGYDNPIVLEETAEAITALDADGNEVTITKRPERVIVNYTSMLGLWYMAGGEAIARPDSRSGRGVPEAAKDIETTGHMSGPNTEKIISLQPDLVVLSGTTDSHRRVKEVLEQTGTETILLNYENYSDFVNVLDLFARIIDNREVIEEKVPEIEQEVRAVINQYRDRGGFSFLSLFASTRSVSAELNVAHTAHIAMMLGGENIAEKGAPQRGQKRITLSMEHIIQRDPDVVFVTVMGDLPEVQDKMKEDLMSNQAWAGLEAVKEDRVYYLPGELFLYKPNERFPEAFEMVAELAYE